MIFIGRNILIICIQVSFCESFLVKAETVKSLFLSLSSAFCNFNSPGKCFVRWVNWRDAHFIKVSSLCRAAAKESGRTTRAADTLTPMLFAQQANKTHLQGENDVCWRFFEDFLSDPSRKSWARERASTKNQRGVRSWERFLALINMTRHCFYCASQKAKGIEHSHAPFAIYINQSFFLLSALKRWITRTDSQWRIQIFISLKEQNKKKHLSAQPFVFLRNDNLHNNVNTHIVVAA